MARTLPRLLVLALVAGLASARADEPPASIREAARRGLAVVEKAARNYPKRRTCFSCHHQTMPLLAMALAGSRDFPVEPGAVRRQVEHTRNFFGHRLRRLNAGKRMGGGAMTVGYALWALELGRHPADEVSAALVENLLRTQEDDGSWAPVKDRPPLQDSRFTATVLAAHFAGRHATDEQEARARAAIERARDWIVRNEPVSQEDRNSRLGGLKLLGAAPELVDAARTVALRAQRADGGWGQTDDMASDAYATGQTLFTLFQTGTRPSDRAYRRGVEFLLRSQEPDGSWFVQTRSKPVQTFFDNGDPHGKSQFISIAASSWATTALVLASERVRRARF